jgi:hypothetical protein
LSSYRDRFDPGRGWEVELAGGLVARGWDVCEFGQGQLSDDAHAALRNFKDTFGRPSGIRWLPDLLAWRGDQVYMIDAKSELAKNEAGPNVSIELDAFDVGVALETVLCTPMLYVWRHGAANPRTISNRWTKRHDGNNTAGAGTAFLLMDKKFLTPLSSVFGEREAAA